MIGGTNSNNGWRTVWEQLPNTYIDSDGGKDTKAHLPFSGLLGQLLRLIRQLRVMESYLSTSWNKVTFTGRAEEERQNPTKNTTGKGGKCT